jgi:hypothetical protein
MVARGKYAEGTRVSVEKSRQEIERTLKRYGADQFIKAKLEAVEAGIVTFEEEFLPQTVLPDGSRVNEWAQPQMEQAYLEGKMPPLLPGV